MKFLKQRLSILWQIDIPFQHSSTIQSVHVDLGGGLEPKNPFKASEVFCVDLESQHNGSDFKSLSFDVSRAFPLETDSVSSFSAYDLVEHIPRWERRDEKIVFPFVNFMNEIFRCLEPGGIFLAVTPAYPEKEVFQDPTHVNYITIDTVKYFENFSTKGQGYGIDANFRIIINNWLKGPGPYIDKSLVAEMKTGNKLRQIIILLKYAKRTIYVLKRRKKSHILWVLQKPS